MFEATTPMLLQITRFVKQAFRNVTLVSGNFIIGYPEETFGEILDSFNCAEEIVWDWANYYICHPLPGTVMFNAFASLGDDRCGKDDYSVYNPGKSSPPKGNFGSYKGYHSDEEKSRSIPSGRDVFLIPKDVIPSAEPVRRPGSPSTWLETF